MNIDREIAEKVMGWEPHFRSSAHYCDKGNNGVGYKVRGFVNEWHPSRLIGQAFEVVEKMRERGFYFRAFWSIKDDRFFAFFGDDERNEYGGIHGTPAMAICKAAIAALKAAEA